jgi:hypothetical protein
MPRVMDWNDKAKTHPLNPLNEEQPSSHSHSERSTSYILYFACDPLA